MTAEATMSMEELRASAVSLSMEICTTQGKKGTET
jgi:hypothetical protein